MKFELIGHIQYNLDNPNRNISNTSVIRTFTLLQLYSFEKFCVSIIRTHFALVDPDHRGSSVKQNCVTIQKF